MLQWHSKHMSCWIKKLVTYLLSRGRNVLGRNVQGANWQRGETSINRNHNLPLARFYHRKFASLPLGTCLKYGVSKIGWFSYGSNMDWSWTFHPNSSTPFRVNSRKINLKISKPIMRLITLSFDVVRNWKSLDDNLIHLSLLICWTCGHGFMVV